MDDENESLTPKEENKRDSNIANDVAKKIGDKLKDKAKKDAGKNAAVKGKLAAASGPVLFWAVVIIVAIIILIGIIMFFMTMPGMVMDKIKSLFSELGNYVSAFFGADTTKQIKDENIYSTLDYLEEMGYDLKGFGFLTDYYTEDDTVEIEKALTQEEKNAGYKVDKKIGVVRNDADKIILAKSDYIFTYIASDNYIYTLKNYNISTLRASWNDFWGFITNIISAIETANYKFHNFFFGPINDFLGITDAVQDAWGRGLIALYYEDGSLGKKGNAVNTETLWNHDTVKIDTKKKQLLIAKNELFNTNVPMKYSLDGWTGRYGMPVEFLMSVHVATMMPDLAYNVATSFDTNVNLYLRVSEGSVNAYYKGDSGTASYSDLESLNSSDGFDFVKIVNSGLVPANHGSGCTCVLTKKSRSVFGGAKEDYYDVIDPSCKAYADKILKSMKTVYDGRYKTYIPYIASVSNHWYRDVYYVIDLSNKDDKKVELVTYDYDYETLVKERWSLYETYDASENVEKAGEFKLYITTPDGNYATSSDISNYYGDLDKTKLVQDTKIPDYYLFDGTKEEANDMGYIVSKKAVTLKFTDEEFDEVALRDLSWNLKNNVWSAYKASEDSYTGPEEKAYPDSSDEVEGRTYTQVVLTSGNIKQTGEAQRAETNSKIKEMFLSNTYFRYDGTEETAEIITKMRNKIKETKLGEKGIAYGALNALYDESGKKIDVTDYKYMASDLGLVGDRYKTKERDERGNIVEKEKEFSVKDYSGQVSINQDSLNAFSMLENTHTLDADYIYRDFKELIVELGYFTKEELTEETPKLLEWLVPDTGSAGYPDRTIDKRENEYGTMIHSKGDIDANKQFTLKALLNELQNAGEEVNPDSIFDFTDEEELEFTSPSGGSLKPEDLFKGDIESHPELTAGISANEFVEKSKEMWTEMSQLGYDYCVGRRAENCAKCSSACKTNAISTNTGACTCDCDVVHCNHNVNHNPCGLSTRYENSKSNKENQNVCCATFVSWALTSVGIDVPKIMKEIGGNMHGAYSVSRMCVDYLGGEIISEYKDLEPGDVMSYIRKGKSSIGHVDILGEQSGDNFVKYNGGHSIPKNSSPDSFSETKFKSNELCFGIRLFDRYEPNAYVGYNGNEMVVSPVTGILLEYGTYENEKDTISDLEYRVNVDLKYGPLVKDNEKPFESKNVSDKVGYAKILVLNSEYYQALEMSTENRWNTLKGGTSLVNPNGTYREVLIDDDESKADQKLSKKYGWTETEQMVYGYKEFAESYQKGGIAGYIIYIDGFVCEMPDKSLTNNEAVAGKIPYEGNDEGKKNARISTDEATSSLVGYSYKTVTPDNFSTKKIQLKSEYREDDAYKTASEKATNKYKAEIKVKYKASHSMYLSEEVSKKPIVDERGNTVGYEPIIFIKEGTVLGRTMTDKELLEAKEYRNGSMGTYEENKPNSIGKDKEADDNIIGNYLRIMMRDLDGTVVENVEDYMKLDYIDEFDWFELFYWTPFESGGCDLPNFGPECVSCCTPGEVGVGLVQETDTVDPYHPGGTGGGVSGFFRRCIEADPVLCAPLKAFTGWSGKEVWCDVSGDSGLDYTPCIKYGADGEFESCRFGNDTSKDWKGICGSHIKKSNIQKALSAVCNIDREAFLKIQMKDAKEQYLDPILAQVPWLADRPECVQGAVMHLHVWGARWSWIKDYKDKSDEDILYEVRNVIATTRSTASDPTNNPNGGRAWNEPEIAFTILDGRLTKYDVEEWVRSANPEILEAAGMDVR